MKNAGEQLIVGRRVSYFAGYGGMDGDGLIVAVNGTPNEAAPQSILGGIGRVIRHNDCTVDVILFDGRKLPGIRQCGIDAPGIGIKLRDRVHGAELIEVAKRNAAAYATSKLLAEQKGALDFQAREAARQIDDAPLFYWNGMKDAKGAPLQRCWYSDMGAGGSVTGRYPPNTISIYARDYGSFSAKVRACFAIENNSDLMTDYFDKDHIRVIPAHPLYPQVKKALQACEARRERRAAK